jgi:hypothetical protein
MPQFERYFGMDYSGAETATSSLKGLRVYSATLTEPPAEVLPHPGPRKHWTRRGLAEWLATELRDGPPTLVGIDHAFSFPLRYFEVHRIPPTGRHSSTTSSNTGRPMKTTCMWILFAKVCAATALRARGLRAGGE